MDAENLSCKQLAEHLSAYLDGQLDEELSAMVELHLTGCQQCRATLAHWQRLQQAIRSSELRRPALDLAEHMTRAALESVRARRGQLSALQSLLSAYRAEAEFVRTGQDEAMV